MDLRTRLVAACILHQLNTLLNNWLIAKCVINIFPVCIIHVSVTNRVECPNNGHIWTSHFVLYRVVVLSLEVNVLV